MKCTIDLSRFPSSVKVTQSHVTHSYAHMIHIETLFHYNIKGKIHSFTHSPIHSCTLSVISLPITKNFYYILSSTDRKFPCLSDLTSINHLIQLYSRALFSKSGEEIEYYVYKLI